MLDLQSVQGLLGLAHNLYKNIFICFKIVVNIELMFLPLEHFTLLRYALITCSSAHISLLHQGLELTTKIYWLTRIIWLKHVSKVFNNHVSIVISFHKPICFIPLIFIGKRIKYMQLPMCIFTLFSLT